MGGVLSNWLGLESCSLAELAALPWGGPFCAWSVTAPLMGKANTEDSVWKLGGGPRWVRSKSPWLLTAVHREGLGAS